MESAFSSYIKELDTEHEAILEKLKIKREELRRLESEYYNFSNSRRESLSREIYALRSEPNPDMQKIQKLQEELESLPSHEELEIKIGKLREEIKQLENDFIAKPFKVADSTITPMINFKVDIDGLFLVRDDSGKYNVKEDLFGTALNNYKVEVDPNTGLPIRETWVMQGSDTFGYPLTFTRELKINNSTIEIVKPIKREREVIEYVDKPVKVEKIIPSLTCPRCSWNLTELAKRVFCPNCSLSLYDAIKMQVERELGKSSLKNGKKKRWFL